MGSLHLLMILTFKAILLLPISLGGIRFLIVETTVSTYYEHRLSLITFSEIENEQYFLN